MSTINLPVTTDHEEQTEKYKMPETYQGSRCNIKVAVDIFAQHNERIIVFQDQIIYMVSEPEFVQRAQTRGLDQSLDNEVLSKLYTVIQRSAEPT